MAKIIEEIRARLAEAQKRLTETNQCLQAAQQAQVQAQHNFNVWNMALQVEQRDDQLRQAAATAKELPPSSAGDVTTTPDGSADAPDSEGMSKTDVVRDLLRRHPDGMTAPDIWKAVSAQFKHRPYLYSILKRLRDRDEVMRRRNRYLLKLATKIEDAVKHQPIVH